jgi:parallel beta-helix repeat protein
MSKALLFLALFFFSCRGTVAATYYLDSVNGNDTNDGSSPATAWKTLAKVNASKFSPGDTILLRRGGTWREQLTFPSSGAKDAPIVLDAFGEGPLPVISGADLVPPAAWSTCGNCPRGVWRAAVSDRPNVVLFDGAKGSRKTAPDDLARPQDWYWEANFLYVFSGDNPASIYARPGVESGARPSGINLTGISNVTVRNIEVQGANAVPYSDGAGIFAITVHLAGPTPSALDISRVRVLNGAGDGIHLENADHTSVDSSLVANNEGAGIELYHSNGKFPVTSASITNNDIHHNHFNGIFIVGCPRGERCRSMVYPDGLVVTGAKISGNKVHDNGAGIYLHETNSSVVSNNVAYSNTDASRKGEGYCVGLSGSSSNLVEKNECYRARLSGIELSIDTGTPPFGSSNNIIRYNVLHDDGTHGIFTNYVPSEHNKIEYNLIYNHPNGSCIMANYMGHEIFNNTCYNNREGIHLYVSQTTRQTGNISVKNNVIIATTQYHVLIEPGVQGPFQFSNNDYYPDSPRSFKWKDETGSFSDWCRKTGQDAGSFVSDPRFSSSSPASPADFALRPDSPAIGSGIDLGSDEEKALGPSPSWPDQVSLSTQEKTRWDIGAFRHSSRQDGSRASSQ